MPAIAIIDDNSEQSGTLKKALTHYLAKFGSNLSVITQFPFSNINDYSDFIANNTVCVLILDERLNDHSPPGGGPVHYKGNELVIELRKNLKDFPIFMVTTYPPDDDLTAQFSQFEFIITRDDIYENDGDKFVPIIIRSANRYLDSNSKELTEFNELAKKVAEGNNDPKTIDRMLALQVKLELPTVGFDDRKQWLDEYQSHIDELDKLKDELSEKLR